jgi:hypothetical protein
MTKATLEGRQRITVERWKTDSGEFVGVNVDGERVGNYAVKKDGFVPFGKRKPRPTEADAQYIIILDEAMRRMKRAARLMDSLQELRAQGIDH